ncbi:SNF2-related protein [Hyalangium gracile]|uniref:SNF2-related protein n=1 Tax=Hyalangium gracile TaxID=394092 RepID=UPI001CCEF8D6|nr:SNF2-related protein [Hyalangium gracile]
MVSINRVDGLRQCLVRIDAGGDEHWVDESRLIPGSALGASPLDTLEAAEWRGPRRFFARRDLRATLARMYEDSDGTPTLFGARVWPLGHQLYASRRILWDRTPRFILADEVGLGKTIEAGYVIQALSAADLSLNVLVVAPGAMTRQWLCELYLRFGARAFTEISTTRWEELSSVERVKTLAKSRLIVSTTAVESHPDLRETLASLDFGLVIVDEAHQFPPSHSLYPWLQELSRHSQGFLALSATPSKRETESLLGLLALVSPGVYEPRDTAALERRLTAKKRIWDALAFSHELMAAARRADEELDEESLQDIVKSWEGVVTEDPVFAELLDAVRGGDTDALDQLVGYVQEFHRIDRRLIRTRRVTLDALGLPRNPREGEILDYEPDADEVLLAEHLDQLAASPVLDVEQWALRGIYQRFAASMPDLFLRLIRARRKSLAKPEKPPEISPAAALRSDPGPEEEVVLLQWLVNSAKPLPGEAEWLTKAAGITEEWKESGAVCARLREAAQWVSARLKEDPKRKLLVFSQEQPVVEAFANHLREVAPEAGAQTFHYLMKPEDLEKVALGFQRDGKCRVLVSDELGGEGRNFEVAWAVLHLDTPISVARVEQRIGRLDRVGRAAGRPVRSVVMRGRVSSELAVIQLHQDVFRVHERSIGGLEFALPRLQVTVHEIASGKAPADAQERLRAEVASLLKQTDEEFELSLDTSRPQLEKANELAEMIGETEPGEFAEQLTAWAKALGIDSAYQDGAFRLRWETGQLEVPLAEMGFDPEAAFRYMGTFERQLAMRNDSIQFFGPGHRLFDVLINALDTTSVGRATVFRRSLGTKYRHQMYLVVLAHCTIQIPAVPGGLIVRAQRHLWPSPAEQVFVLRPRSEPAAEVVQDGDLRKRILAPYQGGRLDQKVEPGDFSAQWDPTPLWNAVRQAISLAIESIRSERVSLHEEAAKALEEDLSHEMGYLRGVAERGTGADATQAREEIRMREELLEAVRQGVVEIDGLAVVIGS